MRYPPPIQHQRALFFQRLYPQLFGLSFLLIFFAQLLLRALDPLPPVSILKYMRFPGSHVMPLVSAGNHPEKMALPSGKMKTVFSGIYENFVWGRDNPSGNGSMRKYAIPYLAMLQQFFNETSYRSVVDYGCGNWELMKWITIPKRVNYLGVDIVKSVIDANVATYETENVHFQELQSLEEAVQLHGDVLIVKDVLQHWCNRDIRFFLDRVLVNFQMALLTNGFVGPYWPNMDTGTGGYRQLDLLKEPFNLQARPILEYRGDERKRVIMWGNDTGFHFGASPVSRR
jgi:SAM-dependent methyltransferase